MSNEQNTAAQTTAPETEGTIDQLTMLKEKARVLGIPFSNNIGVEALRKKINDTLAGVKSEEETPDTSEDPKDGQTLTPAQETQKLREELLKEATALVRCRINNLNPAKADLPGEIITIGNRFVGTIRKMVPFGEATENGYHIPKIIYDELMERKYQHKSSKKGKNGQIEVSTRMVPEFSIEVLPPLTQDELRELALTQQAAERVGN